MARVIGIRKKIGVATHFSEIIQLKFGKKCITLFCTLAGFFKMCGYLQFSFWISIALAKISFSA